MQELDDRLAETIVVKESAWRERFSPAQKPRASAAG
jgi:hypothetical protein